MSTEENVGKAFKASNLPREEVFIVTKLWNDNHGKELAVKSFHESLKRLGLDYVDLYLIHSPKGDKLVETYQALLQLKEQGLTRSIGVSNFGVQHLEGLEKAGLPVPSVNQIELHPYQNMRKGPIIEYCRKKNIALMGYCPLLRQMKNNDPTLQEIAKRYCKTVSQTLIRWSLQKGFITIPKSSKKQRLLENSEVFDFEITDEDMSILDAMPDYSVTWDPTQDPWVD